LSEDPYFLLFSLNTKYFIEAELMKSFAPLAKDTFDFEEDDAFAC